MSGITPFTGWYRNRHTMEVMQPVAGGNIRMVAEARGRIGDPEGEVILRLILSAPDLLAAARLALPSGVCLTNPNVPDDIIIPVDFTMGELRQIAAAITKATGEA